MKQEEIENGVSLVDFLAEKAGCMYVSDLTHLDEQERWLLFETLLKLPPSAASEREWNEALGYIEHLPAQHSAEEARKRLMKALCEGQGKHSTEKNEQEEKG